MPLECRLLVIAGIVNNLAITEAVSVNWNLLNYILSTGKKRPHPRGVPNHGMLRNMSMGNFRPHAFRLREKPTRRFRMGLKEDQVANLRR